MEARPRILMLAPEAGFVSRRITQEAGSLARLGAAVDILPTLEPLPTPGSLPAGVRVLSNAASSAASGRAEVAGRRVKLMLRRRLRPVHRAVDAVQYVLTDRAERMTRMNVPQALDAGPYDLIVAHDIPVLPLGLELKRTWAAPLIVDLHEIFPEQTDVLGSSAAQRYWRRVEEAGLPEADGLLFVNEAVEAYAVERYPLSPFRRVLHNAVPYVPPAALRSSATIRDVYGLPADGRIAVFAGSLRQHGNLATMVEGFAEAAMPGWVLALIGDGPMAHELRALVRRRGLDRVVKLGHRAPQHTLVPLLASGDLGIIPFLPYSRNLEISTPAKLYEYVQARLPILATPLPLVAPVLAATGTGTTFDASTVASTAAGIRRFIAATLPTIASTALERAARTVSWEAEEAALVDVVDRSTAGRFGFGERLAAEARA